MKKYLQQKLNNEKGMTLIELLAVIVIIAIIAAIAIPAIGNIIENSRYSAIKADATNTISAASIFFAEDVTKTKVTVKELKDAGYIESQGKLADDDSIAPNTSGDVALTSKSATKFSGDKTVTFSGATIDGINKDQTKGSDVKTNVTIDATGGTPATPAT